MISAFFVFGALIFHPAVARAGMHICNRTSTTVNVAMATIEGDTFARAWGWWRVAPGACTTPISGDLDRDFDYFYYAHGSSGATWEGNVRFCIDPLNAFDFNDDQDSNCYSGVRRNFRGINYGGLSDYTVNLTN